MNSWLDENGLGGGGDLRRLARVLTMTGQTPARFAASRRLRVVTGLGFLGNSVFKTLTASEHNMFEHNTKYKHTRAR